MADYEKLKSDIASVIKNNGAGEITGAALQEQMLHIVDTLNEGKAEASKLTELESELAQFNLDVFNSETSNKSADSILNDCYINTSGAKVPVSDANAKWYVNVYKTEEGVRYQVKGSFIVATMAAALFADAECTQFVKFIHSGANGKNVNVTFWGDGNYLAVPNWEQGSNKSILSVTEDKINKTELKKDVKVSYLDAELFGFEKSNTIAFSGVQVKTAFSNLGIKKGDKFSLKVSSSSSWSELGTFYGSEWIEASRRLELSAKNGVTYEYVAKEDIEDIKVFLISASNLNISVVAEIEKYGRLEDIEESVPKIDARLTTLEDGTRTLLDVKLENSLAFTDMAVKTAFSNLGIKKGETFTLSFSSASSWSQLGVFYGSEWSERSRVLLDNASNGKVYEFEAKEDVNEIKAFLISASNFNIDILASLGTKGTISNLEEKVNQIEASQNAVLPFLESKADNLAEGANLQITSVPNAKNYHTIGCGLSFSNMGRVRISHGLDTYAFGMVEIDGTNVYEYITGNTTAPYQTSAHGLAISDFLRIVIRIDASYSRATLYLTSANGSVNKNISWMGCTGDVILTSVSGAYKNISLNMGGEGFKKDVWIFGDSYADYWMPVLYERSIKNFYADAYSGRNSAAAYTSLVNALKLGQPKVLVWMLGMNDGDSGSINASYKSNFLAVQSICKSRGIAFVPCTIPNCPVVNNTYKNAFIRENAEHYVDMAKILGADSADSTWYDGLIAADNVHPSEKGKVVVANALLDSGIL